MLPSHCCYLLPFPFPFLYGYINTGKSRPRAPPNHQLTLSPPPSPLPLSPSRKNSPCLPAAEEIRLFSSANRGGSPFRPPSSHHQPQQQPPARRRSTRGELSRDDDEGTVDGGAAAGDGPLRRRAPGRGRLVHAGAHLDTGREQAVRAGAGRARPALPGLGQGGALHRQDGRRGRRPLQEPRARRPPNRVRPGALPRLRPRRRGLGLHPAVGRQRRRRPRRSRGLPARLPLRRLRRREAARRPHAGAGEEEGGAVDRGRAQVVPPRPEEVRQRGLEEHFTQLRADQDANAGGQPRAEVLHQAQLRGQQGQEEVEHPRHHHGAPHRRPASLAIPVIHDQPAQRTGSERGNGAVLSASRHQATRRSEWAIQFAGPDAGDAELRHGFARSRPAVWTST